MKLTLKAYEDKLKQAVVLARDYEDELERGDSIDFEVGNGLTAVIEPKFENRLLRFPSKYEVTLLPPPQPASTLR